MKTRNIDENHMVLNTKDAPWNQPDADPETPEEIAEREAKERRELKAAEYADGLRQMADLIEAHPDLTPEHGIEWATFDKRDDFLLAVKALTDGSTVGEIRKYVNEPNDPRWAEFRAERSFGPVKLQLNIKRHLICKLVTPAQPAVYDCPDSLLAEAEEYNAA